ncbi:protein kinase-like protein [Trypanosoma grayi]|uniref:protein kinase-like protein n=1 Tax=Trypanosoma grayi TaxID=71804 RepID=UPI0004F4BD98|nr:protein kinase-like protein [Trypanosoma grayi]KEG14442.1 protein kinase-like protein [Trypanosoma grayi]
MTGARCCRSAQSILVIILLILTDVWGAAVWFKGSVYKGIVEKTLHDGGATFQLRAAFPIFEGYNDTRLKGLFLETLAESQVLVRETGLFQTEPNNSWQRNLPHLIEQSHAEVLENGRSARLTFGPAEVSFEEELLIVLPCLPLNVFQDSAAKNKGENSRSCLTGNAIVITPTPMVQMDVVRLEKEAPPHYIAGNVIKIPFIEGDNSGLGSKLKVMEGYTCSNTRSAMTRGDMWDGVTHSYRFVALRGGIATLCYAPFPDTFPLMMVKVGESLNIAGPEGVSTEPPQIRSGMEFTGTVYGTNLTERDVLILSEQLCNEFTSSRNTLPELSLSSSTRALFSGVLEHGGIYHLCYLRDGSEMYLEVTTLLVEAGGDAVIEGNLENVLVDKVTQLLQPATISSLQVKHLGRLVLKQESLNVSAFVWSGGTIVGHGDINCMGVATITSHGHEPRTLSVLLRNYGEMVIDVHQINLEGDGAIHNYGNLTITVASMGNEGVSSIRSCSRNNVIINRGGVIRIATIDKQHSMLCQTRIINTEGTLILSGKLNFTDLTNGEKAQLIVPKGASVAVSDARFRGGITLAENSEIMLTDDCVFVSTIVKGNKCRITITGDSILLDSLTVVGDVRTDILGRQPDSTSSVVATYGTTRFGEGTCVTIKNARFVTSAGLAKLHIDGVLISEFDTVDISGNTLIQAGNVTIFYGKSSEYILPRKESNSLVSFVVPHGASLVAMDTANYETPTSECNSAFMFSDSIVVEGRMLLQGCLAIPFGGSIRGSVGRLEQQDDISMVFSHLNAAGIHIPISRQQPRPASAILGGEMHLHSGAQLFMDEISMRNAVLTGHGVVQIEARTRVMVDRGSRLSLQPGWVLNASLTHVEGVLEADTQPSPLIYGHLEIASGSEVKLYSSPVYPCLPALDVVGEILWGSESHIECIARPLTVVPESHLNAHELEVMTTMRRMTAALPQDLECPESLLREEAMMHIMFQQFLGYTPYDPPPNVPTAQSMFIAGVGCMLLGALTLFLFLRAWGMTLQDWCVDIVREPPLRLDLTQAEFTAHWVNYWVLASLVFAGAQLSFSSFHPKLPLPIGFMSAMCLRSVHLLMPHHGVRSEFQVRLASAGAIIWGFIAVPVLVFSLQKTSAKVGGRKFLTLIQLLSKLHYYFQLLTLTFAVPIKSLVLDYFACNTFLKDLPTCETCSSSVAVPFAIALFLSFTLPWGGPSETRQSVCDLNFKVSSLFALRAGMLIEIGMWKVFYQSPVLLLISNLLFQSARVIFYSYTTPTPYRNINRVVIHTSLAPLIITIATLLHVARVHLGLVRTCQDGETYFKIVFGLVALMVIASVWYNVFSVNVANAATNDPAIDAFNQSLERIRSRIQNLRYELMASASMEERESVLRDTTLLHSEVMEKQEQCRFEKNRYLANFYCSKGLSDRVVEELNDGKSLNDTNLPSDMETFLGSPDSSPHISDYDTDNARSPLTQEEMETFRCGPALGSGSYGSVYLGILQCGRLVAVKYVNAQNSNSEAFAQVQVEMNTLKELSHPNIICYYGCSTADDHVMLFMEFAVAGSLTSIVRNFDGLNESMICLYTYQILLGLRYLHEKGVVHRDIKGENILVDGFGVAKLADFGCSKVLAGISGHSNAGCESLTGSPFWMAPEVIRNEPYGTKADIWSVGCTVVEMLKGGNPPWRDEFDNVYSAMYYVGSTDSIPVIPEGASDMCLDFLKQCFQRDATKRPSADELLKHLWLRSVETTSPQPQVVPGKYLR